MRRTAALLVLVVLLSVVLVSHARQRSGGAVQIDPDDTGSAVTAPKGPEAGVWGIAETRDLPVRCYGLVDGPKATSAPGRIVNVTARPAPNDTEAAQYSPAIAAARRPFPASAESPRE